MWKKITSCMLSVILLCALFIGIQVNAEDRNESSDDGMVKVTEEMAIEVAEEFSDVSCSDGELKGHDPIKIYDVSEGAIGYIVNMYKDDIPYGYVILDSTIDQFICEYSFGEDIPSPYESALQQSDVDVMSFGDKCIYKIDMITYGVYEEISGTLDTNMGDSIDVEKMFPETELQSNNPSQWGDIFVDPTMLRQYYTLEATNYTDFFSSFTEDFVTGETGRYACAVSAMANCANYFGVMNIQDFATDYQRLWDLSGTTVDHTENGISYGLTLNGRYGSAFTTFCREKGLNISSTFAQIASFGFFRNCIDDGGIGIVSCGITTTEKKEGHAMAVEGYSLYRANDSSAYLHVLRVADGWNAYVRNLNNDFGKYNYYSGYSFL